MARTAIGHPGRLAPVTDHLAGPFKLDPLTMPSALDQFMPRTRMEFPDGAVLSVGTVSCDDQIHQAVYLSFTPPGSNTPMMELELPPKTVDLIIRQLQEHANQARFVNGARMLEYPEPYEVRAPETPRRTPKAQKGKMK